MGSGVVRAGDGFTSSLAHNRPQPSAMLQRDERLPHVRPGWLCQQGQSPLSEFRPFWGPHIKPTRRRQVHRQSAVDLAVRKLCWPRGLRQKRCLHRQTRREHRNDATLQRSLSQWAGRLAACFASATCLPSLVLTSSTAATPVLPVRTNVSQQKGGRVAVLTRRGRPAPAASA
jgi:hypothetical protein